VERTRGGERTGEYKRVRNWCFKKKSGAWTKITLYIYDLRVGYNGSFWKGKWEQAPTKMNVGATCNANFKLTVRIRGDKQSSNFFVSDSHRLLGLINIYRRNPGNGIQ